MTGSTPERRNTSRRTDDAVVGYTVKELLAKLQSGQDEGFARLEVRLDSKADKAETAALSERLGRTEKDVSSLLQTRSDGEAQAAGRKTAFTGLQKVVAAAVTLAMIATPIIAALLASH